MDISKIGSTANTSKTKKGQKKLGTGTFSSELNASTSNTEINHNSGINSLNAVGSLLFMQEAVDEKDSEQQALTTSHNILDILKQLQIQLITASVNESQVKNMEKLVYQIDTTSLSKELAMIVDDIRLRLEIELAKYQ